MPLRIKAVLKAKGVQPGTSKVYLTEHVSDAERCGSELNIRLCGRALRLVAHGQSKRSTNVPLTHPSKPNHAQIKL